MLKKLSALGLSCLLVGCAAMSEQSMLARITEHQEQLTQIWSGYNASQRFYGYIDDNNHIYLNRDTPSPTQFVPLNNGLWRSRQPYPELNGVFHINAQLTQQVSATIVEQGARRNYLALTSLMLHEDFHGFQRETFINNDADTLAYAEIGSIPAHEIFAAVRFERRLLQSIISNFDNPTKRDELIAAYVAHRQTRDAILPTSFAVTENAIERSEGTATWFEMHAMQQLGFIDGVESLIYRRLQNSSEEVGDDLSTRLFSQRLYGTGAAICEILQRLQIPNWQTRVAAAEAPFALLQQYYPLSTAQAVEQTKVLQTSAAFREELINAQRFDIPESALAQFSKIAANYIYEVTFSLDAEADSPFDYSFAARRIVSLPNGLLLPRVDRFNASAGNLQINISEQNVLLLKPSDEGSQRLHRYAFTLFTDHVYLDGAELGPGAYTIDTQQLRVLGVELIGDAQLELVIEHSNNSNNTH